MSVIGRFSSRTAQQVLCLLLCVCTWRGPVPVLHNHASLPDAAHRQQHSLTCHVAVEASAVPPGETDWHWHFALWSDIGGTRGCDAEQLTAEADGFVWTSCVRLAGTQTRDLNHLADCFGHVVRSVPHELLSEHVSIPSGVHRSAPSSFLASLRAENPLVTIIGVNLI